VPVEINKIVMVAFYGIYILSTLFVNSLLIAYDLFSKWKMALLHSNELEKEKTKVQYDNLKNQLNPHFLFNSLTSLNSLIYKDPDLASDFLQQLSKVYRYVLQHKETNLVALKEEIKFVSNYIELLKTRFGKGLVINIDLSVEAESKMIVPVSLQIMIENAIKHNTTDEDHPLHIEIFDVDGYLTIRNNVLPKRQVESSNKQGLENFKKLYSLFSTQEVIVLSDKKTFSIKIPLI
jgi:LytS/YehU family sensor histidine kinase